MRSLFLVCVFVASTVLLWAQDSTPSPPASSNSQASDKSSSQPDNQTKHTLEPPRSDRVNINDLGNIDGQSSSKDTEIDLSPPADDAKAHPNSAGILMDEGTTAGNGDVNEMHPWDPHKAAKDVEVGDFYFKKKNYIAAESRYREALYYKDNDALATYRLAVCLEKLDRPEEARTEFESYLKILPHGPQAEDAKKAIDRLKSQESSKNTK
jgi:tetratricopeptide (TPR) repeat protein